MCDDLVNIVIGYKCGGNLKKPEIKNRIEIIRNAKFRFILEENIKGSALILGKKCNLWSSHCF